MDRARTIAGLLALSLIWAFAAVATGDVAFPLFTLPLLLLAGCLATGRYPALDTVVRLARGQIPSARVAEQRLVTVRSATPKLPLVYTSVFGRAPPAAV